MHQEVTIMDINIRKARINDMNMVNELINHFILTTTYRWARKPVPLEDTINEFYQHDNRHPYYIAEVDGKPIGFAYLSTFRGKDGYRRIAENSLYIDPQYKGHKIGYRLMKQLIDDAKQLDYWAITAWIDDSNQSSITFHERFGFNEVGTMKNIGDKFGRRCSVVIMQLDLL